ncbi:MAG: hypothetical protein COA45_12395 [Zetaproteobacteria bacterium]|nr:MAG: hypothetical protein COA45_12395 [Zetaproteobacteria bacterium]
MGNIFDTKASNQNNAVWSDECDSDINYDADLINRCIVHARMDLVLVVSHLSSANSQLRVIKWALIVCAICLVIIAYKA